MQDKPLLNTTGYLTILDDIKVPDYVRELLRYGPKHPCRTSVQEEQFLANIDLLLEGASMEKLHQDALNKINALTVGYVMKCKYRKPDKNFKSTRQWLKDQGILAVPYDRLPVTWLNTIWLNFFVESFGLKLLSQVTTKLSQLHSNSRNKNVNENIIMWGICGVCTLALTVAKTSSHYDRFAIFVPARSLLLFDLA